MEAALIQKKTGIVSIIVPVYNEAEHIELSLRAMVARLEDLEIEFEIIVVESGSTDNTKKIVEKYSRSEARVRSVHQKAREGMGSAIAAGFREAKGDYLFWTDGDVPYDLKFLKDGLNLMERVDAVAGYRLKRDEPIKRKIYSRVFNLIANTLFSIKLRDINFAFKLFRKEVFYEIEITSKSSFFAAEIMAKCRKKGFKIEQIGVDYKPRAVGETKLGNMKTVVGILKEMIKFFFTGKAS